MTPSSRGAVDLGTQVRRGVLWSTLNNVLLRAGTLTVGIVLARLLVPEQFGVYAVALTVQTVLMTLADLGFGADLIRSNDPDRRAPTVATLGLVSGGLLCGVMIATSGTVARLFGAPDAAPVIALLSVTMLAAGAGVVPYAYLQRRFDQRSLFVVAAVDLVVSTIVTLSLIRAGQGVMSLAWGRVSAQTIGVLLLIRLSGVRPRPGVDWQIAGSVLRFGIPVAGANALSWALLNIDNIVIARELTTIGLGFYVLAFNISNWPMTAIGQVVRSVALPAFARGGGSAGRDASLGRGVRLSWTLAVPAGSLLALLAGPLVVFVYGATWERAAAVLVPLGVFGSLRVLFDLFATFLLARGHAGATFAIQVVWFLALIPALVIGARTGGLEGAGWAHVLVAVVVILPAYLVAVHRAGADLRPVVAAVWPPIAYMVPAGLTVLAAGTVVKASTAGHLLVAGAAGSAVYVLCAWRSVRSAMAPEVVGRVAGDPEVVAVNSSGSAERTVA